LCWCRDGQKANTHSADDSEMLWLST
jgi:hypothetical protein